MLKGFLSLRFGNIDGVIQSLAKYLHAGLIWQYGTNKSPLVTCAYRGFQLGASLMPYPNYDDQGSAVEHRTQHYVENHVESLVIFIWTTIPGKCDNIKRDIQRNRTCTNDVEAALVKRRCSCDGILRPSFRREPATEADVQRKHG